MGSILQRHPELVEEVHEMLPTPDLAPLEEKLNYLKRNIYKALPNTRLESKTDSMAYNRVSIHLTTFKKAVLDSIKNLLDGQQWLAVIDYTVLVICSVHPSLGESISQQHQKNMFQESCS